MFVFRKVKHKHKIPFVIHKDIVSSIIDFDNFINGLLEAFTKMLVDIFESFKKMFGFKSEEQAIKDLHKINSEIVNSIIPKWKEAIGEGTIKEIIFNTSDGHIEKWIKERSANFIKSLDDNSKKMIRDNILYAKQNGLNVDELTRNIKYGIGLTDVMSKTVNNYHSNMVKTFLEANPNMSIESAKNNADIATKIYAENKLIERARMIAETELATAYNAGKHESIRLAIDKGIIGSCVKRWITAGGRVCESCASLHGTVIEFDKAFGIKKDLKGSGQYPPLHPRCRCTIDYEEDNMRLEGIKKSMGNQLNKLTDNEKKSLSKYTGFTAYNINSQLRKNGVVGDKFADVVSDLDTALAKGFAVENITVYRCTILEELGISSKSDNIDEQMFNLLDTEIKSNAYFSSSFNRLNMKDRNVFMNVSIPKNFNGCLYIKDIATEKYKYQEEVLLKRGLTYIIKGVKIEGNNYFLDVEVL